MTDAHVVLSTTHPVAGRLYLEMINESSVRLSDIYQVTDKLSHADVYKKGWREEQDNTALNARPFSLWPIERHLSRVG